MSHNAKLYNITTTIARALYVSHLLWYKSRNCYGWPKVLWF